MDFAEIIELLPKNKCLQYNQANDNMNKNTISEQVTRICMQFV